MTSRACLPLLPALPLVLSLAPAPNDDGLVLAPGGAAGDAVSYTLTHGLQVSFEDMTCRMAGQEVPSEYLPTLVIDLQERVSFVVQEEMREVEDGRPAQWAWTFEELDATYDQRVAVEPDPGELVEAVGDSPLDGRTVLLSPEGASDPEAELDNDVLAGLPSTPLAAFLLPDEPVEVGDIWELDTEVCDSLFAPFGDIALEWSEEIDAGGDEEVDWSVEVRADGWEEEDGDSLLRLAIEGERIGEEESATDLADIPVTSGTATEWTETTHTIEGTLLWDVEIGRAVRYEIGGPIAIRTVTTKDPGQEGPDFETTVLLRGSWSLAIDAE